MSQRLLKTALLLTALVALLGAGAYVLWRGPEVTVSSVPVRDLVQTVVATGRVQNPHRIDIGSQIVGVVRRVPVREGQSVSAGELLIELDDAEYQAQLAQSELAVVQAEHQLRRLESVQAPLAEQTWRQSVINLEQALRVHARNEELFEREFIGQAALDESWRTASLMQSQLVSATHQLRGIRQGGSDRALAEVALQQAKASVMTARSRWSFTRIFTPVDGVLIARNVERGDVVQPGKSLMTVSPTGETQVVVQIDEKHLHWLSPGQAALVSADAFPRQRFAAELVYINPGIDPLRGSVEVKLRVPSPPGYLRQDMTVSVDIEVARRAQVLQVPDSALYDPDGDSPWVLRLRNGRAMKTAVKLGLRTGGYAEILDGLQADDLVITSRDPLRPGQRVRWQTRAQPV